MVMLAQASRKKCSGSGCCWRQLLLTMIALHISIMFFMAIIVPSTIEQGNVHLLEINDFITLAKQIVKPSHSITSNRRRSVYNEAEIDSHDFDTYFEPGSLVLNFAHQRRGSHSSQSMLRSFDDRIWQESANMVAKLLGLDHSIESCQKYGDDGRILTQARCMHADEQNSDNDASIEWYVYNKLDFVRTWGGYEIPPFSAIKIDKVISHQQPVRIFPQNSPPISGKGMPPIIFRRDDAHNSDVENINCDIPCLFTMDTCQNGKGQACLPQVSSWKVDGTPFHFVFSDSAPSQNDKTAVDRKAHRHHNYFATRSLESEIPLSAFDWHDELFAVDPVYPKSIDQVFSKIVFVKTRQQCEVGPVRAEVWAKSIRTTFGKDRFDSFGACFNTQKPPVGYDDVETNRENRMKLLGRYMFTLVPERSLDADHVSELLWDALWAGSIPVHVGAANVLDHVPRNSVIAAGNLFAGNKDKLGEYLQQIAGDAALWSKYHVWRNKNSEEWKEWREKFLFLETPPYCRMCRWAYSKLYGLSWDHVKQQLHPKPITVLDRRACIANNNLIGGPILKEIWMTNSDYVGAKGRNQHCDLSNPSTFKVDLSTHIITRTVVSHDNVLDIMIHNTESKSESGELVLRLEIGNLRNDNGGHFPHVHTLLNLERSSQVAMSSIGVQDLESKVTVLTNWSTQIYGREGKIDILVQSNGDDLVTTGETRRIRVILENLDQLRDVRTEYNFSPFASQSVQDFVNPLELYVSDVSRGITA